MAPLSLKIVLDDGAVTRTMKFNANTKVADALRTVEDKMMMSDSGKEYGLFLTSTDDQRTGIWLEGHQPLNFYILKDGDMLHYLCKKQNLRIRMLDGTVKTLVVEHAKPVRDIMVTICSRLGITNHDEYGLCREDDGKSEEQKPSTGTLTLKKVTHVREKDAKMEQLSKKFKTDDNVDWLDQHLTLRELNIDPSETLLLKRRLFFSDRRIDTRDPVQLNLLYVQTRDAILDEGHPVTSDQAVEFAGIQCQVQYGDYQEDKHKPGFIENLLEFLPKTYASSRGIDKKIFKQHQKHIGLDPLEAKYLYTKTARDLPTYGVTFFLVKEKQKGVKRLVPRLLGISYTSILRLDEVTKEILQTWSLTQIKTFHVGASETFTLNFGDYSDKEYVVKTNEGYRIRDILQGYIDIIARKLAAGPFGIQGSTGGQIYQEEVNASRANMMEVVSSNESCKVVTEHIVGPSKIISVEPGQAISQGTFITTGRQLTVVDKPNTSMIAVKTSVAMRRDMNKSVTKKLNSLNTNSVKIVNFLTDPTEENIEKTKETIKLMQDCKLDVFEGVKEAANKQLDDGARRKLLAELNQLCGYLDSLTDATHQKPFDVEKVDELARNVAELSTQIYFALDPRRSDLLRRSRKSFIEDDSTRRSLQRASVIAAAANSCSALAHIRDTIHMAEPGSVQSSDAAATQDSAKINIDRLNGAVALLLTAQSDPNNIDYEATKSAMNIINEVMPILAEDMKVLAICDSSKAEQLRDQMRSMCEILHSLHMSIGGEDLKKIQDAASDYRDASGKLIFTIGRTTYNNEIMSDTDQAQDKLSSLVKLADELLSHASAEPGTDELVAARAQAQRAAEQLALITHLCSQSLTDPHCQCALLAAQENLAAAAHQVVAAARPLTEDPRRQHIAEDLRIKAQSVAKAVEHLKESHPKYIDKDLQEQQQLKFKAMVDNLNFNHATASYFQSKQSIPEPVRKESCAREAARLNASVAELLAAAPVSSKPDYSCMEDGVKNVFNTLHEMVYGLTSLSSEMDNTSKEAQQKEIVTLSDAIQELFRSLADGDSAEIQDAASAYSDAARKLVYSCGCGIDPDKENEIINLARSAGDATSSLLGVAASLTVESGTHPAATALDAAGANCADAARAMLVTAQVTAPTLHSPACKQALTSALKQLSTSAEQVAAAAHPILQDPSMKHYADQLLARSLQLAEALDKLKNSYADVKEETKTKTPEEKELERLSFLATAQNDVRRIEEHLYETPNCEPLSEEDAAKKKNNLSFKLAMLNDALAQLVAASGGEDPDHKAAEEAISNISRIMNWVVEDTKLLNLSEGGNSNANLGKLKEMCEAFNNICSSSTKNPEKLNEAALSLAKSSGNLQFVFNKMGDRRKEEKVIELARSSREKTSQLLAHAQQLAQVAGERGVGVDESGARVADAAQHMLITAQITAPCITKEPCQKSLLSSVDALSNSVQDLAKNCKTAADHTPETQKNKELLKLLTRDTQMLDEELDKLRMICVQKEVPLQNKAEVKELERLKFITSLNTAQNNVREIEKHLSERPQSKPLSEPAAKLVRNNLSDRLANLNAALAKLLAASGGDDPDHKGAEEAIKTMSELIPLVIEDTKQLNYSESKATKPNIEELRKMCEAFDSICSSSTKDPEKLNEAAITLANSTGNLHYAFSNTANKNNEDKVVELARSSCEKTSQLLAHAQQLAQVAGERGVGVDESGARVADAAQYMLITAQITAPCITKEPCQKSLLSSVDALSSSVQELAKNCKTAADHTPETHKNKELLKLLTRDTQMLDEELNKLRMICVQKEAPLQNKAEVKELERLKFITTLNTAQNNVREIEKHLSERPQSKPLSEPAAKIVKNNLSDRLANLNAALAKLLAASGGDDPDHKGAEEAIKTMSELIPLVIEDTKQLNYSENKATKPNIEELRKMCEAFDSICSSSTKDPEKLNEAAMKLANSTGNLHYAFSNTANKNKEDKVIELARSSCEKTSQLLAHAQQLAQVAGERGVGVDESGARVADAAQHMLITAQITAPCITKEPCQMSLLSSVDTLSSSVSELAKSCESAAENTPKSQHNRAVLDSLTKDKQELDEELNKLRMNCLQKESPLPNKSETEKLERLKFVTTLKAAQDNVRDLEKQLSKTQQRKLLPEQAAKNVKSNLSDRLANLNAALAKLLAASRGGHPDHKAAEEAVKTMSELIPLVIEDAKQLNVGDANSNKTKIDELKAMCEAFDSVCSNTEDPEKLNEAAVKLANSTGNIKYAFSNAVDNIKENKVIELARSSCEKTSQLLAHAQQLAQVAGERGVGVDESGARVADAAQHMLITAQITAPCITKEPCQMSLLSSVDTLSSSVSELAKSCESAAENTPKSQHNRAVLDSLTKDKQELYEELSKLRMTCLQKESPLPNKSEMEKLERLKFITTLKAAQDNVRDLEKQLNKTQQRKLLPEQAAKNVKSNLSDRLANLNAALAKLLAASRGGHPDHKAAEEAVKTMSELIPLVIEDTKQLNVGDANSNKTKIDELKAMCEAFDSLCSNTEDPEKLNEAAVKLANSTGNIQYAFSNAVDNIKENKVIELARSSCEKTSQLLAHAQQLAQVAGERGVGVDESGARVADAAQHMLITAQVTAPSITKEPCQKSLLCSVDILSSSVQDMEKACDSSAEETPKTPQNKALLDLLRKDKRELDDELNKLRLICVQTDSPSPNETQTKELERLKFITTLKAAQDNVRGLEKQLHETPHKKPLPEQAATNVKNNLSDRLAELNAALAKLLAASHGENPDHKAAEEAIKTMSELIPLVIGDTKQLNLSEGKYNKANIDELKAMCEAFDRICSTSTKGPENLNEAAMKLANSTGNLQHRFNNAADKNKEHKITELARSSCEKTSQLLAHAQQLAQVAGERGVGVDESGARVADAAQHVLITAQITAPYITKGSCQDSLLSSVDQLSSSVQDLANNWVSAAQHTPKTENNKFLDLLTTDKQMLDEELNKLRNICLKKALPPPPPARRPSAPAPPRPDRTSGLTQEFLDQMRAEGNDTPPASPLRRVPPPVPVRGSSYIDSGKRASALTQEFLDHMQQEEADNKAKQMAKKAAEEAQQVALTKTIERANNAILEIEEDMNKILKEDTNAQPHQDREYISTPELKKRMESNLGLAAVAAAQLLACRRPDDIDYTSASKSTEELADSLANVAKDVKTLSSCQGDKSRQALLDGIKALCEASRKLCARVNSGKKENLVEVASEFGDKTAELVYLVNPEVDPEQEREVVQLAKSIGDSVSGLTSGAASLLEGEAGGTEAEIAMQATTQAAVCSASQDCFSKGLELIYTAKIVAPLIQDPNCQTALKEASRGLSRQLVMYTAAIQPLASDAKHGNAVKQLKLRAKELDKMLQGLKQDLLEGNLVKKREVEKLEVEDTPMRQLAWKIYEEAQKKAQSPSLNKDEKRAYGDYVKRVGEAIRAVDEANARCKNKPDDESRRVELEQAIVGLLRALLMARPSAQPTQHQSNIVDLATFVKEVSARAADAIDVASRTGAKHPRTKKVIEALKTECHQINLEEFKLLKPQEPYLEQPAVDNIQEVDRFGMACEKRVEKMESSLQNIEDENTKNMLNDKVAPLKDSCNLLRFATKSALATAQGAVMDEMVNDLAAFDARIDALLQPSKRINHETQGSSSAVLTARAALLRGSPARALTQYAHAQRTHKDLTKPGVLNKLKKHLKKLVNLLKSLTVARSRRVATWQPPEGPEVAALTENIYEELDFYEAIPAKEKKHLISESDYKMLLSGSGFRVQGDKKQLEEKLQELSTQLSSMSGCIAVNAGAADTVVRSGASAVLAAVQLHAVAIACAGHQQDPELKKKSEEAVQDLMFVTHNFLKTAEYLCEDPKNTGKKQLLLDACRQLNDAINKVGRLCSSSVVRGSCAEWSRGAKLSGALSAAGGWRPHHPPAYSACLDALALHKDVIQKLREDNKMSQEEFVKSMSYVMAAVCNSTDYAAQCAYLISISEDNKDLCKEGMADAPRIQKATNAVQDTCSKILMLNHIEDAREEAGPLMQQAQELQKAVQENVARVRDRIARNRLAESATEVSAAVTELSKVLQDSNANMESITSATLEVLDAAAMITVVTEHPSFAPRPAKLSAQTQQRFDDVVNNTKDLTNKMVNLVEQVKTQSSGDDDDDDDEMLTWVMFDSGRKAVLDAFDRLIKSVMDNGRFAGILEMQPADSSEDQVDAEKNYLQLQLDLANKWLRRPSSKPEVKCAGGTAVKNILDVAETFVVDLKSPEREEMQHVAAQTKQLVADCNKKYDQEKATQLMDRLKELKKAIERGVVTMVVEDLVDDSPPLQDLDEIVAAEKDEKKRQFILEKKIAELLDQLSRVKKTTRCVARTCAAAGRERLASCSEQTSLLAPQLVKAAQERVRRPHDQTVLEKYKTLLSEYSQALTKVRELCDQSVDPMEFVQTAGDTIQRIREEFNQHNDTQKCAVTSSSITKLASRAVSVGLSSAAARRDPELQSALEAARARLKGAATGDRASRLPDWASTTAEILKATNDVESVLGGETIFKKQPEPDQPIYNAALNLHASLRGWSARDNEIVAAAKRMAVLMARLSDHMSAGKNHDVLSCSKSIVTGAAQVAALARKLAQECTDVRIRTDLLQVCDTIPTISGQLKMLTTVKGASLGQGSVEDKEAMDMLIGNAQNLMASIENVVKSAAAASVKIRSQLGGPRIKWVRKTYS